MSRRNPASEVLRGFWSAIGMSAIALGVYYLVLALLSQRQWFGTPYESIWKTTRNLFTYLFWGIGFSQLIYIIPTALFLRHRRQLERMKGVILGAAVIGLLCGSCFVIVFPSFSNYFILR